MRKFDLEPLYVPHGVDTEMFQPMPEARQVWREMMEMPEDAFLVGMVAANAGWNPHVSRKAFPQSFDAFGRFLKKHPDAYLYVHSRMHGGGLGNDLLRLAKVMEIPEDRFRSPEVHAWHLGIMDHTFLSGLYNSFDVLLNPSMAEGFGVPIVEAQACGVPVITSNHSSMTELTHAGWMVQGDRWWDEIQCGFAIMPSIGSIVDCLEQAYKHRDNTKLREGARRFALAYDADRVMEKFWTPALEQLAQEIPPLNGNFSRTRNARRADDERRKRAKVMTRMLPDPREFDAAIAEFPGMEQLPGYGPPTPVPIFQWEREFEVLLELYRRETPAAVLEIGTYHGGTLFHWLRNAHRTRHRLR